MSTGREGDRDRDRPTGLEEARGRRRLDDSEIGIGVAMDG